MRNRIVVGLVVVVLAIVGAALWLAGDGPGEAPAPVRAPDDGPVAPPPAAEPAPRSSRAAAGRRWVASGEGSVAAVVREYGTGRALADVEVALEAGAPGPDTRLVARTGADGAVAFAQVAAFAGWTLRVRAPEPLADAEVTLAVAAGRPTDVGTIYLAPAFTVPGIVVDEVGAPVEGAVVNAMRWSARSGRAEILRILREIGQRPAAIDSAVTAADGTFRLTKLVPGTYDLGAQRAGFVNTVEVAAAVSPESAKRPLRLVLRRGLAIDGRVVRKSGGNVAGIPVVAFPEPRGARFLDPLTKLFAVTAEDGAFRLDGLPSGRCVVAAAPEGEPATLLDRVEVPLDGPLVITLGGDATLEGTVTGPDAKPVAGAVVFAFAEKAKSFATAATDAEGRYAIRGLAAGSLAGFLVTADGLAPYPADLAQAMRGAAALTLTDGVNRKDVQLAAGATVRGVVVEHGTGTPVAGATLLVADASMFLGASRSAVSDAVGRFEIRGVPTGPATLVASKDGWVQIGLEEKDLAAARRGEPAGADAGTGAALTVAKPDDVVERTLELARAPVFRGRVVDPSGAPVAAARVSAEPRNGSSGIGELLGLAGVGGAPRLTDSEGRFEVPGGGVHREMRVVARAPGLLAGTTDFLSAPLGGAVEGLTIRLRAGATITGRVADADGRPVAGAVVRREVEADGDDSREPPTATTDATGAFVLSQLPPGRANVTVAHPRYLVWTSGEASPSPGEGETVRMDATLRLGATLDGVVLDPAARPVAGATVDVRPVHRGASSDADDPLPTSRSVRTDATGTFLAEGLREGAYTVQARADGFVASGRVEASTGSGPLTLTLAQAFTIRGVVRVRGGEPVADIEVVAAVAAPPVAPGTQLKPPAPSGRPGGLAGNFRARSGAGGAFEIGGLPAGTYQLRADPGIVSRGAERPNLLAAGIPGVEAGTEGLVIELPPGNVIAANVFVADGSPATEGNADCVREDEKAATSSDRGRARIAAGRFEVRGLSEGTFRVTVSVPGHATRTVSLATGAPVARIDMTLGATLRGRVLQPDGAPAANAWVSVTGSGNASTVRADEDGRWEADHVPEGTWRVTATVYREGGGLRGESGPVEARDGATVTVPDVTCAPAQRPGGPK